MRVISTRSPGAKSTGAQAAMGAEARNIVSKKTPDPVAVHDWRVVRQQHTGAMIGSARMILG